MSQATTTESASAMMASAFNRVADMSKKGAREGMRLTKTAARMMHVDVSKLTTHVPRTSNLKNIRRAFRARHSQALGSSAFEVDDEDDESSDSGEDFSDEQVQERVDRKYFDSSFQGTSTELHQLQLTYADEDGDVDKELQTLETLVKERSLQMKVVNATLKKRILKNYSVFIRGVMQVSDVNDDLLHTADECRQGRERLALAKRSYVECGMQIIVNKRRRANLEAVRKITIQMNELYGKYTHFLEMLDAKQFKEAIAVTRAPLVEANLDRLQLIDSMRDVIDQWITFTTSNDTVLSHIDTCIEDCITRKFVYENYVSATEAATMVGDKQNVINKMVMSLYRAPEEIMNRAVSEVSSVKGEADIRIVASGVEPEHLLLCFCQTCGRLADYLARYSSVCRCHLECSKHGEDSIASMHQEALAFVKTIGKKIGFNVHSRLVEMLQGSQFSNLDLEKVLHCFHIVMMLVEATSVLGCDKDSMAAARSVIKRALVDYVSQSYHPARGTHIVNFMETETWETDEFGISALQVVAPISPDSYKQCVKSVKHYVSTGEGPEGNPFYTTAFMVPPSIAEGIDANPLQMEGNPVVTSSAVHIGNCIFEYICRTAVRFPPLAAEVLDWCEELVSLYVYVTAANFISVSRGTPLEEQNDFSASTRACLAEMRHKALQAAPSLNRSTADGLPLFPPAVFETIQHLYGSKGDYFGLMHRLVAMESSRPLVALLRESLKTVSPLLSGSIQKEKRMALEGLERCTTEMFHVGMHRLASAVFPLEWIVDDVRRTKYEARSEMKPSGFLAKIVDDFSKFRAGFTLTFPTVEIKNTFWRRLIFAVQLQIARGFTRAKKTNDLIVSHMLVDAQAFNHRIREQGSPGEADLVVLPDFIVAMVRAFYEDPEGRMRWLRDNHEHYPGPEVCSWLAEGDKDTKRRLEEYLKEVQHVDAVPVAPFL